MGIEDMPPSSSTDRNNVPHIFIYMGWDRPVTAAAPRLQRTISSISDAQGRHFRGPTEGKLGDTQR
jgi:hypothetical protein